jgi:hypothetical protein
LENRSFEPNLETRYTNYLRHEFSSGSGAQIVPEAEAADLVLSGQILSVSVPTLSFSQTTTLESRTEVVVTVKVEETRTKRLVWAQMSKGTSEFFITPDLQFNRVLQNRALEQAGRFIADRCGGPCCCWPVGWLCGPCGAGGTCRSGGGEN